MKFHALSAKFIGLAVLSSLVLAGTGLILNGCGRNKSPEAGANVAKTLYTCGMHPQVIQDKPGNCPICGMKLTPIRKQGENANSGPAAPSGERKITSSSFCWGRLRSLWADFTRSGTSRWTLSLISQMCR